MADINKKHCCLCTMDNFLYPIDCPGHHHFCLTCIKCLCISGSPSTQPVQCPLCRHMPSRAHINNICTDSGKIYKVPRHKLYNDIHKRSKVWIYEGRNNGWWYYDLELQDVLDEAQDSNKTYLDWTICGQPVCFDFLNMKQTNTCSNAVRAIKYLSHDDIIREKLLIKGVSGMVPSD